MNTAEIRAKVQQYISEEYAPDMEDGFYRFVLSPDYQDTMEKRSAIDILGEADPEFALTEYLENAYEEALWQMKKDVADRAVNDICQGDDTDAQLVRDLIDELCIFTADVDHFLAMTFPANIYLDTGDSSYDFALNNHFPHWGEDPGEKLDEKSSLVWLAKQQGYSKEQLEEALDHGDMHDPHGFLESVRVEEANANSHMLAVGFLVSLSLRQMIDVKNRLNEYQTMAKAKQEYEDDSFILIDKTATCGLIDAWDGGGSVLGIELEQDVKIPLTIIRSAMPDGGDGISNLNWYGLCESVCEPVKALHIEPVQEVIELAGVGRITSWGIEQAYRLRQHEYDVQDAMARIAAKFWSLMEEDEEEGLPDPNSEEYKAGAELFQTEYGVSLTALIDGADAIAERFRDSHDWTLPDCDQMDAAIAGAISEMRAE